jgi:SAM-dependent methyltransferase
MMPRMSRKHNQASRKFHDRIAPRYDAIYDDAFWEFHDRVTWAHLKAYLPRDPGLPVLDLGCGTGKWGLKLLKAGFPTHFVDLSIKMLDTVHDKLAAWAAQPDLSAKAARATVLQADAVDLSALPAEHFALAVGMGDVVSICSDAERALAQVHRLLQPGGVFVFTVDNRLAGLDHFADSGNLEALRAFVKTGQTHWLTRQESEQFEVHMFLPSQIETLAKARGFEVLSRIPKTVLPVRKNPQMLAEPGALERLVELEQLLAREPSSLGRASHLQLAVRRV